MNTRHFLILGLAGMGLALAAPAQAAPDFIEDTFIVARNDRGNDARYSQDSGRHDRKDKRGKYQDEAGREESQGYGYGYGYERRQQERIEEDSRSRGRR